MTDIWQPIELGAIQLPQRFAMAPMTRSRAKPDGTPGDLAAEYYAQRASVGLLISEGTQPSEDGQGYLATPGIYMDAHVAGWSRVASAVHGKGGRLFIQLMHVGRVSHPDNTPHHRQPVAPSAIAPGAKMYTLKGMVDIPEPRAMGLDEIAATIDEFRDAYGGSIENRARLAIEVAKAIAEEIGPDRTAIRLSPGVPMNGIDEGAHGPELYRYLVGELDKLGLVYLHLLHIGNEPLLADIRALWKTALIVNRPGRPRERIGSDVKAGLADIEAYGQAVLANPDFLERLKRNAPLNEADRNTFYAGGAEGYVDYPTL
ncbi:2,4-dienoyl-CoA reductase-like NADH-dependent reductase (Old Yellow Enzyme family) [Xanthomonas translucens]